MAPVSTLLVGPDTEIPATASRFMSKTGGRDAAHTKVLLFTIDGIAILPNGTQRIAPERPGQSACVP